MTQALLIMPSVLDVEDDFAGSLRRLPDISVQATSDALVFFHGIARSDVVLIHHELENDAALTLVRWLRRLELEQPVIVVGLPPDNSIIVAYYEAGVTSYLLTTDEPHSMDSTIRDALAGASRLDGHVTGALIQRLATLRRQVEDDRVVSENTSTLTHLDIAAGM